MNEIKLSDNMRNSLRAVRIDKKIKGSDICKSLGKHSSFISHIENGVVKTVEFEDLKNILRIILQIDGKQLDEHLDELVNKDDKKVQITTKKNSEQFDYEKSYEERQEEIIENLTNIFEDLENFLSDYPSNYEDCEEDSDFEWREKFLTTFITLMWDSEYEVSSKFYDLMRLPLFKLNPSQFQGLINRANELLEYEYVFESGKNSKTQKYPHYRVKYKLESLPK